MSDAQISEHWNLSNCSLTKPIFLNWGKEKKNPANCIDVGRRSAVQEIRVLPFIIESGRVRLQHQGTMGLFRHTEATCAAMLPPWKTPASGFCSNKDGWFCFTVKAIYRVINGIITTPERPLASYSWLGNTQDRENDTSYWRYGWSITDEPSLPSVTLTTAKKRRLMNTSRRDLRRKKRPPAEWIAVRYQ